MISVYLSTICRRTTVKVNGGESCSLPSTPYGGTMCFHQFCPYFWVEDLIIFGVGSRVGVGSKVGMDGGYGIGGINGRMAIQFRGDNGVRNWDAGRMGLPPAWHLTRDNFAKPI